MPFGMQRFDITIPAGQLVSSMVDLREFDLCAVYVEQRDTASTINLQGSYDGDDVYPLNDTTAAEPVFASATAAFLMDGNYTLRFRGVRWVQVVLGTAQQNPLVVHFQVSSSGTH